VARGVVAGILSLGWAPKITTRSNRTARAARLFSCTGGIVPGKVGVVTEFSKGGFVVSTVEDKEALPRRGMK